MAWVKPVVQPATAASIPFGSWAGSETMWNVSSENYWILNNSESSSKRMVNTYLKHSQAMPAMLWKMLKCLKLPTKHVWHRNHHVFPSKNQAPPSRTPACEPTIECSGPSFTAFRPTHNVCFAAGDTWLTPYVGHHKLYMFFFQLGISPRIAGELPIVHQCSPTFRQGAESQGRQMLGLPALDKWPVTCEAKFRGTGGPFYQDWIRDPGYGIWPFLSIEFGANGCGTSIGAQETAAPNRT